MTTSAVLIFNFFSSPCLKSDIFRQLLGVFLCFYYINFRLNQPFICTFLWTAISITYWAVDEYFTIFCYVLALLLSTLWQLYVRGAKGSNVQINNWMSCFTCYFLYENNSFQRFQSSFVQIFYRSGSSNNVASYI